MCKSSNGWATIGLLLVSAWFATAAEDDALRQEALRLNDQVLFGDDEQQQKELEKIVTGLKQDADHAKRLLNKAVTMAKETPSPFTYNGALVLAALARESKEPETCQLFLRSCLSKAQQIQSMRKQTAIYQELISLFIENRQFGDAEKTAKEFLQLRGDESVVEGQLYVLRLLIKIYALDGRIKEAFELIEPQLRAFSDDLDLLRTHAWLLQYDGQYAKAATVYEQILSEVKSDNGKELIHEDLGNLYSDSGDVDKATTHLQWVLDRKPDDPRVNNALGYVWADNGRNLDDAEKMIRKALDKEPASPAYLDSMGWVLYKKKKYADAKEYFLKAIRDPQGRHAEIYDHLAEAHKALGEKDDAVSAWRKALDVAGTSKHEKQRKTNIEKKLKENPE